MQFARGVLLTALAALVSMPVAMPMSHMKRMFRLSSATGMAAACIRPPCFALAMSMRQLSEGKLEGRWQIADYFSFLRQDKVYFDDETA